MNDENDHGQSCAVRYSYNAECNCGYDVNQWSIYKLRSEVHRLRKKMKSIYKAINE